MNALSLHIAFFYIHLIHKNVLKYHLALAPSYFLAVSKDQIKNKYLLPNVCAYFLLFFECIFLTSVQFTLHVTSVKLVFCQTGTSRPLYQFLPAMCCTDNDDSKSACATRRGPFQEDKFTSHLWQCISRSDVLVFTHQSQLSVLALFNTADKKNMFCCCRKQKVIPVHGEQRGTPCFIWILER